MTALGGGIYALDSTVNLGGWHGQRQPGEWHRDGPGRRYLQYGSTGSVLTLTGTKVKGNKATTSGDDLAIGP